MKHKPFLFLFLLSALSFNACEDVIELDLPDNDPALVVDGWLTDRPGEKTVRLTLSANYFSEASYPAVSDALVALHDREGPVDTLQEKGGAPGVYATDYVGRVGGIYHLVITTADGKQYASQAQQLRAVPPIDSIYYEFIDDNPFQEEGYYVKINTREPAGQGDYYRWRQFINGEYQNTPFDIVIATDEFVDGNFITELEITVQPLQAGDTCRVEQQSISREAYDFLFLVRDQTAFVGSIFDSPPIPIPGNIFNVDDPEEEVLGFFGVSAVSEAEVIIEEE